jgi:hypothetical protein
LDLSQTREKLAEAHLFLAKMMERERQLTGEPFNSYLSAFLVAAMAVRDPFHTKANRAIKNCNGRRLDKEIGVGVEIETQNVEGRMGGESHDQPI